jgi:hypothetical protein
VHDVVGIDAGVGDPQIVEAVDAKVGPDDRGRIDRRPHPDRSRLMVGWPHRFGQRFGDRFIEVVERYGAVRLEGPRRQHGLHERARVIEPIAIPAPRAMMRVTSRGAWQSIAREVFSRPEPEPSAPGARRRARRIAA